MTIDEMIERARSLERDAVDGAALTTDALQGQLARRESGTAVSPKLLRDYADMIDDHLRVKEKAQAQLQVLNHLKEQERGQPG